MKQVRLAISLLCIPLLVGCAAMNVASDARVSLKRGSRDVGQERMLIWRGWLTLEVYDVSNTVTRAIAAAEKSNGYIEQRSDSSGGRAELTIRVPSAELKTAMASLESLGSVAERRGWSGDGTEEVIDTQARLKNRTALRDRLRELLQKATDVKDILALEKELHRIQGEIDSMEGRLKAMKGKVDYATIHLTVRGKQILGPLGYALKSAWWVVEKLFVLRPGT